MPLSETQRRIINLQTVIRLAESIYGNSASAPQQKARAAELLARSSLELEALQRHDPEQSHHNPLPPSGQS